MKSKRVIILDGPPASGKTTFSRVLVQTLRCPCLNYKALGLANILSIVILRLATNHSMARIRNIRTKEDPILLLNSRLLNRMRFIVFLMEIPYKVIQKMLLLIFFLTCNYLVIDEFLILRATNYINVYLHGGLTKWQTELLLRLDLALFEFFAKHGSIRYIYIDRDIEKLKNLWCKREPGREYSETYLTLVRLVWKIYRLKINNTIYLKTNFIMNNLGSTID